MRAVVVPAVLRPASGTTRTGGRTRIAVASRCCVVELVVPKAVHKAGFHPTAVFAPWGPGACGALNRPGGRRSRARHRGSMASASSNIWPKAPGPSDARRLGGAVRLRAVLMARAAFRSRTVFEGTHGLFTVRDTTDGNYECAARRLRHRWVTESSLQAYPVGR